MELIFNFIIIFVIYNVFRNLFYDMDYSSHIFANIIHKYYFCIGYFMIFCLYSAIISVWQFIKLYGIY